MQYLRVGVVDVLLCVNASGRWGGGGGGGGGGLLPFKGLMGTCGQPGYVFRVLA